MHILGQIKKNIKYYLSILIAIPLLLGSFSGAVNDLLWKAIDPSYNNENISTIGKDVNMVGAAVIKGGSSSSPSIIVKVTRILLSLTIALAVTMILYNGMMYIVKTGQGKDGKDLTKNIAYIVVGILIALFSVVIITLIRSVPKTLDEELIEDYGNTQDNTAVDSKGQRFNDFIKILKL